MLGSRLMRFCEKLWWEVRDVISSDRIVGCGLDKGVVRWYKRAFVCTLYAEVSLSRHKILNATCTSVVN
jgi:hypothetical protein